MSSISWRNLRRSLIACLLASAVAATVFMTIAIIWHAAGGPPLGFSDDETISHSFQIAFIEWPIVAGFVFILMSLVGLPLQALAHSRHFNSIWAYVLPVTVLIVIIIAMDHRFDRDSLVLSVEKLLLGITAATVFWLIRRPDKDAV